ncbi:MAG: CsgG/HfaB family protein [Candidatus Cloacimonetes bacterium]|nr:CsgG/HfaB family protein [Candidatus Cloacimonadota bacterium]
MKKSFLFFFVMLFNMVSTQAEVSPFWTGDGRSGITITVYEIGGVGLTEDDQILLPLIQSTITGIFRHYSAMTVFDQQYIENILRQQRLSLSGDFSESGAMEIGRLTNAQFVVFGNLTKIGNNFNLSLAVSNVTTGERVASFIPTQVSLQSLRDFSAVREACRDILLQLGVNLTERSIQDLSRAEDNIALIEGAEAFARGRVLDMRGDTVEAAIFYFQAANSDPTLLDAVQRVSVISSAISDGSLGFSVRNRFREHDAWRDLVQEIRTFYQNHYPYTFTYMPDVEMRSVYINFQNRTAAFNIGIRLEPSDDWKTINEWRRGLRNAQGNDNWNFNLNQIGPTSITVTLQVVNAMGAVLSATTHTFYNVNETETFTTGMRFSNINADRVEGMYVRVSEINGVSAQRATDTGMINIKMDNITVATQRRQERAKNGFGQVSYAPFQFDYQDINSFAWKVYEMSLNYPLGNFITYGFHHSIGGYSGTWDIGNKTIITKSGGHLPRGFYGTVGPAFGFTIPGEAMSFYVTGLWEIGYFGGQWMGLVEEFMTPSVNVGMVLGRAGAGEMGFNLNYRFTLFENTQTHGIGIGFGVFGAHDFFNLGR